METVLDIVVPTVVKQGLIHLIREGGLIPPTPQKLLVNPLVVNQSPPKGQVPPSPQQPQQPRRNMMGDDMKLPVFKGTRLEDPE